MNFKKLLFPIIFIAFFSTITINAQSKKDFDIHISGHTIDKKTGDHLPYVTITIKGTTIGVVTDASGHFLIKDIPIGEHTFTAEYAGYASKDITVKVDEDDTKPIDLRFELEPQILQINDVVVTGSRTETNRREAPVIVSVASTELLEKTASNNVAEVLNFQPGLRVEYNCSNCGVPQLRINGLKGEYSQILLDSRPVFSSLAAVYGLEQLPASMIERVEVIRGGGSALYGSSAIGGVVNIITKDPMRSTASISNNTGVTEKGTVETNTSLNASIISDDTRTGLSIYSVLRNRDYYDRNGDGFSEVPEINLQTIGFRAYHRPTQNSRITADYHYIGEFRRGGNNFGFPPHEADIAEQLQHKINGGGLKYDYYSDNFRHRIQIYSSVQKIDRESYFGAEQDLNAYGRTEDLTVVGGVQYVYDINNFLFLPAQFTIGSEYNRNDLTDEMKGYNRLLEQNSYSYGLFFQNEWKNDKLSFLVGGRLDKHNKVENPIFSPRVNLRYTPIDLIGLRASYSSGYRAPQAYDEDLHVSAVGGEMALIELDPNLKPEYSNSVSGSVDFYKNIGGIEINVLAEGFYTNLRDVFALTEKGSDSQGNLILERVNESGAIIKGINLEFKAGLTHNLIFNGAFTFQKSTYKEDFKWSENPDLEPQREMFRSPDQFGYFSIDYQITKNFMTTISTNYTGKMLMQHYGNGVDRLDSEVRTSTFWDAGIRFAYDFVLSPQMTLQISAGMKNIFDAYQNDIEHGATRDTKYLYGPSTPRTYFVGAKFTL